MPARNLGLSTTSAWISALLDPAQGLAWHRHYRLRSLVELLAPEGVQVLQWSDSQKARTLGDRLLLLFVRAPASQILISN